MLHLAMISKNGTVVWDVSLNEKNSPSKKNLFKLPKSCSYHGYSDDKGILNFITGQEAQKVDFKSYHKNRNQYYCCSFKKHSFIQATKTEYKIVYVRLWYIPIYPIWNHMYGLDKSDFFTYISLEYYTFLL